MAFKAKTKRGSKAKSGIALGGIGTGGVELRQDGAFYNFNIFNNWSFVCGEKTGYGEYDPEKQKDTLCGTKIEFDSRNGLFFLVRYQVEDEEPKIKLLQIEDGHEFAAIFLPYYRMPWLSGVDKVKYESTFPIVNLTFEDEDMPFDVKLEAFSPFIPYDVKNSSLPAIIFNFEIWPKTEKKVKILLVSSLRNYTGYDTLRKTHVTEAVKEKDFTYYKMSANGMDTKRGSFGSESMLSLSENSSYHTGWEHIHKYYEMFIENDEFTDIDDTNNRNYVKLKDGEIVGHNRVFSSIGVKHTFEDTKVFKHTFIFGWNFPNLYPEEYDEKRDFGASSYYYANFFKDSNDVVLYVKDNLDMLTSKTKQFKNYFYDSTIDKDILDQINSQFNTLVTSAWLTRDKNFGVQEGLSPERYWGPLTTIDVSIYGGITAAMLFPELDKNALKSHTRAQSEDGIICHGIIRNFNISEGNHGLKQRLDLNAQYSIMVLRAYFFTNDMEYLKETWPSVRKALDHIIEFRDMNKDGLPDMEGVMCTYDNFPMYGAASVIASGWLSAMAYAVSAAKKLGDFEALEKYSKILEKGKKVFEDKLWNGQYYRLYNDLDGAKGDLDEGCLVDQMIGEWTNHFIGAESFTDENRRKTALKAIMKRCFKPDTGLANCQWPGDKFRHPMEDSCWNDQANTSWTGVELAFASFLIYEGLTEDAERIIKNVNDRYKKAGMYYDHQEFGGHYFRPLSAFAIINAYLGLNIKCNEFTIEAKSNSYEFKSVFSYGRGIAHYTQNVDGIKILNITGEFTSEKLTIKNLHCSDAEIFVNGSLIGSEKLNSNTLVINFGINLKENDLLEIKFKL